MWSQLALSFQHGDLYVYSMMTIAFVGLVIIFERIIMLQFVYQLNFGKFLDDIRKMILAEDTNRAINFCKKVSGTSLPRIGLKALEASESDPSRVRGVIEEESMALLPSIENRINALPPLATVVLLIGMLGTVDHLWTTFSAIDILDTAKKQATASQGIASSLTHTAMGLLVCMVILIGHQIVRGMAVKLVQRLQHGVTVLTNLIAPAAIAMTAMPVAVAASASATQEGQDNYQNAEEYVADANAPAAVTAAAAPTESFNEAAVDDIKDEEEII